MCTIAQNTTGKVHTAGHIADTGILEGLYSYGCCILSFGVDGTIYGEITHLGFCLHGVDQCCAAARVIHVEGNLMAITIQDTIEVIQHLRIGHIGDVGHQLTHLSGGSQFTKHHQLCIGSNLVNAIHHLGIESRLPEDSHFLGLLHGNGTIQIGILHGTHL